MDAQASRSSRERAFSPNDLLSNRPIKRQKTSLSGGSRSRSAETVKSSHDPPADVSALDAQGLPAAEEEDHVMTIDIDPSTPQTPDRQQDQCPRLSEPKSTKVTLNLRHPGHPLEPTLSSPVSPTKGTRGNDVKVSVEESEVEMSNVRQTSPSAMSSNSGSPPIEVIDDDPDEEFGGEGSQVTILQDLHDNALEDPTNDFPFRNETEPFSDSVYKLGSFITNSKCSQIFKLLLCTLLLTDIVHGQPALVRC